MGRYYIYECEGCKLTEKQERLYTLKLNRVAIRVANDSKKKYGVKTLYYCDRCYKSKFDSFGIVWKKI